LDIAKPKTLMPRRKSLAFCALAGLTAMIPTAQFHNGIVMAAVVRATMIVNVQVTNNCAALLSSSTTALAASSACRNSAVATTLSPTISSTSLSTLAPVVLLPQNAGGIASIASASPGAARPVAAAGSTSKGAVTQQFNALDGSLSAGSVASQFIVSAADEDGQIVMITY
jgi:hypothetical protein